MAVHGRVGGSVYLPGRCCSHLLPCQMPLLRPVGRGRLGHRQGHSQHGRVRNRTSMLLSADRPDPLWQQSFRLIANSMFPRVSLLQIISNDDCKSIIIEVPLRSILLSFFAGILGSLYFPPQLMSAVYFEQKSIQPRNPSYSVICSEWPFLRQPYSRRHWE